MSPMRFQPESRIYRQSLLLPARPVDVPVLTRNEADYSELFTMLASSPFRLSRAVSLEGLRQSLRKLPHPLVICDCCLGSQSWRDVLMVLAEAPLRPQSRLVVSAGVKDDCLWSDLADEGAASLMVRPYSYEEVFCAISGAWLDWKSEFQQLRRQTAAASRFRTAFARG